MQLLKDARNFLKVTCHFEKLHLQNPKLRAFSFTFDADGDYKDSNILVLIQGRI